MSRLGKKPIAIPKGVQVGVQGRQVEVKGPKGRLEMTVHGVCGVRDGRAIVHPCETAHVHGPVRLVPPCALLCTPLVTTRCQPT